MAFVRMAAAHRLRRGIWIMLPLYTACNGGRGMVKSLNVSQCVDGCNDSIMRVVPCHERASLPAIGSKTMRRWVAIQPVSASYKLLYIERFL